MLIGGAIPWLFSSFAINSVSRAAALIVEEARRQFGLGVLEGTQKPDYRSPVAIATSAAQKELLPLALLGVVSPILVGLLLKEQALAGFLAGIILSGQLLAAVGAEAALQQGGDGATALRIPVRVDEPAYFSLVGIDFVFSH